MFRAFKLEKKSYSGALLNKSAVAKIQTGIYLKQKKKGFGVEGHLGDNRPHVPMFQRVVLAAVLRD